MGKVERVRNLGSEGRAITGDDYEDFFENGAMALHLVAGDGTILGANQAELDTCWVIRLRNILVGRFPTFMLITPQ